MAREDGNGRPDPRRPRGLAFVRFVYGAGLVALGACLGIVIGSLSETPRLLLERMRGPVETVEIAAPMPARARERAHACEARGLRRPPGGQGAQAREAPPRRTPGRSPSPSRRPSACRRPSCRRPSPPSPPVAAAAPGARRADARARPAESAPEAIKPGAVRRRRRAGRLVRRAQAGRGARGEAQEHGLPGLREPARSGERPLPRADPARPRARARAISPSACAASASTPGPRRSERVALARDGGGRSARPGSARAREAARDRGRSASVTPSSTSPTRAPCSAALERARPTWC